MWERGNLPPERQVFMKEQIKLLLEEGNLPAAESALHQFEKVAPHDHDLYLLKGVFFLMSGEKNQAIAVMEAGLQRDPTHYNLLFNLGYLLEEKDDILTAINLYRQAEYAVRTPDQAQDLKDRIASIKGKIKSQLVIGDKDYIIKMRAGKRTYHIEYPLAPLLERKQILHHILEAMDGNVKTSFQIECGTGIISRSLQALGLESTGIDSSSQEILKALVFEMQGQVRKRDILGITQLYHREWSEEYLAQLPAVDMIILSPLSLDWYTKDSLQKTLDKMKAMAWKARRQFFYYLPPGQGKNQPLHQKIKTALSNLDTGRESNCCIHENHLPGNLFEINKGEKKKRNGSVIPLGLEGRRSPSRIIQVELEKCRDIAYFSYSPKGWHPFTAAIKEYLENQELTYDSSILKTFFQKFQPQNRQQQLLEEEKDAIRPLCQGWPNFPWYRGSRRIPKKFITERMLEIGGNQHFGPNSRAFGEKLFQKLIHTYQLLKMNSYHPEVFPDGYILGYLLVTGDDYRFIVMEGQHRTAALSLMGMETLLCQYVTDENPNRVSIDELDRWNQVQNGLYQRETAARLFFKFFQENGENKARRLGII